MVFKTIKGVATASNKLCIQETLSSRACLHCMQDIRRRPSALATIGYLVYKRIS